MACASGLWGRTEGQIEKGGWRGCIRGGKMGARMAEASLKSPRVSISALDRDKDEEVEGGQD